MNLKQIAAFSLFGATTILFKRKKAILGTIIITDKCNLSCKHCAVNNIHGVLYPYEEIKKQMESLYKQGIRILFFCGGETFMWHDGDKTLRSLVIEAKRIGFNIVNIVTNGTFPIDIPEADIILLSLDGTEAHHNEIRGDTYNVIFDNIHTASSSNIILYMAINNINKADIKDVCDAAKREANIKAVSFNFHTPYSGTEDLALSIREKQDCCDTISALIDEGYPIFNLKSAFPYIVNNSFPVPCYQCVVLENGRQFTCGRCILEDGLCEKCGYFFAAEYSLVFKGNMKVIGEMLKTYLRYI
jgi:MoaA/NifB/PqqE/SkfB family radical SAM enzyme